LLADRVKEWTGRDIGQVFEIRDLLIGPGCRAIVPVVVCPGRLSALRETLPGVVAEFGEAVLVDWCPEGCGAWASESLGLAVSVVRVRRRELDAGFARNAGARRAIERGADWLLFLDAGVVAERGLHYECEERAARGHFALGLGGEETQSVVEAGGLLLTSTVDFVRAGRYDESLREQLAADLDLSCRLALLTGSRPVTLSGRLARWREHAGDEGRVREARSLLADRRTWERLEAAVGGAETVPVNVEWVRRLLGRDGRAAVEVTARAPTPDRRRAQHVEREIRLLRSRLRLPVPGAGSQARTRATASASKALDTGPGATGHTGTEPRRE
jgi:hypothetical protein